HACPAKQNRRHIACRYPSCGRRSKGVGLTVARALIPDRSISRAEINAIVAAASSIVSDLAAAALCSASLVGHIDAERVEHMRTQVGAAVMHPKHHHHRTSRRHAEQGWRRRSRHLRKTKAGAVIPSFITDRPFALFFPEALPG